MKQHNNTTLGHTLSVKVPENNTEFDALAGKPGACLEAAVVGTFRGRWNAEFRDDFLAAIEERTGIPPTKGESGGNYYNRVINAVAARDNTTPEAVLASFQPLAEEIAASIPFDPSPHVHTVSLKAPAKRWLDLAAQVIEKGRAEAVAKDLTNRLGCPVTSDLDSLARAIGEDQRRKARAANTEYGV